MLILEHGNKYHRTKQFLCTACWCKFEAEFNEYYDSTRVDGGHVHHYFACKCPECGREAGALENKS